MTETPGRSRSNLLWIVGVIGVIGLLGGGYWFVTKSEDHSAADITPASPTTTGSASQEPPTSTPTLHEYCAEKVDPPADGTIEVVDKSVTINDDETAFKFYLQHDVDLVAVNVTFDIKFMKDGKDVTNELGVQFSDQWSNPEAAVPPGAVRQVDANDFKTPDGWTEDNITLDVTVGSVEYWCTPKEAE